MEGFEGFNVRELLGTKEPVPPPLPPMIKDRDWDADLAYERLKVVRSVQDVLSAGINRNSIEIPPAIAHEYELLWSRLRAIEKMEAETVKWGR